MRRTSEFCLRLKFLIFYLIFSFRSSLCAYETRLCLENLLRQTPPSVIRPLEDFEESLSFPVSNVSQYVSYLNQSGVSFHQVLDPDEGLLFYINNSDKTRAGHLARFLEKEFGLRLAVSVRMLFMAAYDKDLSLIVLGPEMLDQLLRLDLGDKRHIQELH